MNVGISLSMLVTVVDVRLCTSIYSAFSNASSMAEKSGMFTIIMIVIITVILAIIINGNGNGNGSGRDSSMIF
jgi:hypothetical protein